MGKRSDAVECRLVCGRTREGKSGWRMAQRGVSVGVWKDARRKEWVENGAIEESRLLVWKKAREKQEWVENGKNRRVGWWRGREREWKERMVR